MKARSQTFSDKYFNHMLALGLTTSLTLVIIATFFMTPKQSVVPPDDVVASVQDIENSNAQTFTLPPELVQTPSPSPQILNKKVKMKY